MPVTETLSLKRRVHESDSEFVKRIFEAVSQRLTHYRDPAKDPVPFRQNWILYMLSWTGHPYFKCYEFYNGDRALRRGYGFCSQFAFCLWYFLRDLQADGVILRFYGHVINQIRFENGETWLLDADYGVIVPHSLEHVREDLTLIDRYYGVSEEKRLRLKDIYRSDVDLLSKRSLELRLCFENATFFLIWGIPVLALAGLLVWKISILYP